jgi:predicted transcriptional regulator of viral defense system
MKPLTISAPTEHARKVFKEHGGMLRTREALANGVHPRTLYAMRDAGELEQHARGVFRLAELPSLGEPDLVTVAKRIPQGVLCLISALAFHRLTTQVPHQIHLALPRTARHPKLDYPPIHIFRFSEKSFNTGISTHSLDGVPVRIYSPEKTLADAFKYRNKIGLDVAIEALRTYASRPKPRFQEVLNYARTCRVEKIIRPYLEASI